MNKQEAIEKIEKRKSTLNSWEELTRNRAFDEALDIVRKIDEPKRPVVPQCVADMIVRRKKQGDSLVATLVNLGAFGDALRWIRKGDNGDTFAKAWLFGCEVEKEKLYTAKLKLTGEYLVYYASTKDLHHDKTTDNAAKRRKVYHFTEDYLVKYHIWGSNAYEVKEVEE